MSSGSLHSILKQITKMTRMESLAVLLFITCGLAGLVTSNDGSERTALDDFVFSDESLEQFSWFHASEYDFHDISPFTNIGYTAYMINMTSGDWLTEDYVGIRSHWWHILAVIVPDNLKEDYASTGGVYVTGSMNEYNDETGIPLPTDSHIKFVSSLATGVGMPFAALLQVPNAHITFSDDPEERSRSGDAIVAYTWEKYLLNTDQPELNVYLPMVRSAVRAMDAMTQFSEQELETSIEKYIITGASKRGWTTWLTGAMDQDRIIAIAPIVWDAISVADVFHQQYRDYAGWSWAIHDYVENNVVSFLDTPEMEVFQDLIDPIRYRKRLTMPKFIITGLMDEFQMPDDEQFWWDDIPDPKWLLKSPNTEHIYTTGLGVLLPTLGTWITYILNGWEIPSLSWEYDDDSGDITVEAHGGEVYSAQMWYATTCNDQRRDFRIASLDDPCECGPVDGDFCVQAESVWQKEILEANSDGTYTGHREPPPDGKWDAFVVNIQLVTEHTTTDGPKHTFFTRQAIQEITGSKDGGQQGRWPYTPGGILEFTSRASIVPNIYPYEDCTQDGCMAPIV